MSSNVRQSLNADLYSFFKDRSWLRSEFPELIACSEADVSLTVYFLFSAYILDRLDRKQSSRLDA